MKILVMNSGSSSLKFGLFSADSCQALAHGCVVWKRDAQPAELRFCGQAHDQSPSWEVNQCVVADNHAQAVSVVRQVLADHSMLQLESAELAAIGHRVVHGGTRFRDSTVIDQAVRVAIEELTWLAPLHNPSALAAIEAAESAFPGVPQVAVFDTAYFAPLPPQSFVYPLPYAWLTDWGVRRFGFHGTSHAYCAQRAATLLGRNPGELSLVVCHIGNGCSASAIRNGHPVATTMGFTPLDGLTMGTRPGSIDPGILLHIHRHQGLSIDQLDHALHYESGLLGISGISSDYRQVGLAGALITHQFPA